MLKSSIRTWRYALTVRQMATSICAGDFYTLNSLSLGAEVRGIDLKRDISDTVVDQIKADVTKYRLLIFKNQGTISGRRHVEITRWFGEPESTFYKHPKSPDPDVFRVSNNEQEGCTGVGRTGWHIDGSFQPAPFGYSLYHMVNVPRQGDTVFAPLHEIITQLDPDKRQRWDRLWMVSDRRSNVVHPLVYSHPLSSKETLCFHLGMTDAFIWDLGSATERPTDAVETSQILQEIHTEFVKNNKATLYSHKWEQGDFIISDNLAVGHEASPETQAPMSEVGLRVMHRTTVKGVYSPTKKHQEYTKQLWHRS